MVDVFISYARQDREIAKSLAEELQAKGYEVWWDAALVGSDDFYEVILSALSKAKAAIVIWSKHSVCSRFVRDEARFALHKEKLLATRTPDLDIMSVPFGFQSQHMDEVGRRDRIIAGIAKLGVRPRRDSFTPGKIDALNTIGLVDFIVKSENPKARKMAAIRLANRKAKPQAQPGAPLPEITPEVRALITSRFHAFVQGLTFQVPPFQLRRQGFYTSLGVMTSVLTLTLLILILTLWIVEGYGKEAAKTTAMFGLIGSGFVAYILYVVQQEFLRSRNWLAGGVISFVLLLELALAAYFLTGVIGLAEAPDHLVLGGAFVACFAIWAVTTWRGIYPAR